ncbi:hypothetical protein C9J03_16065 [Photobacterium gaetbulicola]|uniref:Uncharacterized protein n=2 Tax=Photobacterium gaetbulicola TaxID=1295392 RepID=A0A0C5X2Q2_9GAMM|nr:hypothetical protein H744_2c2979 [Photobacterium gaetbulicola Gung47]PSU06467.1 hypothetical protein C9J03_16065 [Photobacterium gaetbulicola]
MKSMSCTDRDIQRIKSNILKSVVSRDFLDEIEKIKVMEETKKEIEKVKAKEKEILANLELKKLKGNI